MDTFKTTLQIIGINPFVFVPKEILERLFEQSGKTKGFIPVHGEVNGKIYTQTLLRFKGEWRLYINTQMLKDSPKRIGETLDISISFDPRDRSIQMHPKLAEALNTNPTAKKAFENLTPSRQKEILRYISNLKTNASIQMNVDKALGFLTGKSLFMGRKP